MRIAAGASLQDGGRSGWRRFGVPTGGAFDQDSLILGNSLLGNAPFAPGLEMPLLGGKFEALAPMRACIVGAEGAIRLLRDGRSFELDPQSCVEMEAGDALEIGAFRVGVRAYLCVEGGFRGEEILGSVSGQRVIAGDVLQAAAERTSSSHALRRLPMRPPSLDGSTLRVIPAPGLSKDAHRRLFHQGYRVSLHSDRRGVRLEGEPIMEAEEHTSEPLCVGAIQATPRGQLLVIGPDGPTIGGYPKVGALCLADVSRLAQLRPGDTVRLEPVDLERARALRRERSEALLRIGTQVRGD